MPRLGIQTFSEQQGLVRAPGYGPGAVDGYMTGLLQREWLLQAARLGFNPRLHWCMPLKYEDALTLALT